MGNAFCNVLLGQTGEQNMLFLVKKYGGEKSLSLTRENLKADTSGAGAITRMKQIKP